VDPLTIERLEVVKGPSSVLYGSDAVGGTVNVITRSRDPAAAGKGPALGDFDWERRAYYRYASAEDSNIVRGELGGAFAGRVGAVGGVSYKDFNDLSGGRDTGLLEETGYEEFDGDAKTTVRLAKDVDLVLAYQQANLDDVPRTHSTVFSKSFHLTEVGTDLQRDLDQRRQLVYSQLQWRDAAPWLSRATASLSYHLQEETEDRIQGNGRRRKQGFDDGQLGAWLQMESPSPVGTLTYGAEIYHDEVDSFARDLNADGSVRLTTPRGPVADNASYDLFGVYLQDRIVIADRVEVIPGGRFNYALARADQVDPDPAAGPVFDSLDEDYHAAAGSLRLLYRATETWNLFGGASQGFRAPNLSDLTRFDVARSGELETPAPDLDPEKFLSLEVGTKVRLEEAKVEGYLSYHYTFIDDLIDRFPTGEVVDGLPVVTKENVGDGFIHGVELSLAWNFYQGFTAFGSFAWLEGEADTVEDGERQREPLSRIQPATALLGLRWDSPARRFWVEGTIEMVDNQDRLSPGDEADTQRIPPGGTPGYTVYGLRAGMEVIEDLNVFAGVENLTDKDYRVHGSGVNEVGTNVFVGADWRF
jgi:hemoglobin/transferrin/lactoferrin receptor protein